MGCCYSKDTNSLDSKCSKCGDVRVYCQCMQNDSSFAKRAPAGATMDLARMEAAIAVEHI